MYSEEYKKEEMCAYIYECLCALVVTTFVCFMDPIKIAQLLPVLLLAVFVKTI